MSFVGEGFCAGWRVEEEEEVRWGGEGMGARGRFSARSRSESIIIIICNSRSDPQRNATRAI